MRNRSIPKMILLTIITLGFYILYWFVSTSREMRKLGGEIPNAILIIVPLVNIWWLWKYSKGVEAITCNKMSTPITFLLLLAIDLIGVFVVQDSFNNAPVQTGSAGGQDQVPTNQPVDPAAPTTASAGVGVVASESNDPLPESDTAVADQSSGQSAPKPVETPEQPETATQIEEPIDKAPGASEETPKPESGISPEEPQPTAPEKPQAPASEEEKNKDPSAGSGQSQNPGPSL